MLQSTKRRHVDVNRCAPGMHGEHLSRALWSVLIFTAFSIGSANIFYFVTKKNNILEQKPDFQNLERRESLWDKHGTLVTTGNPFSNFDVRCPVPPVEADPDGDQSPARHPPRVRKLAGCFVGGITDRMKIDSPDQKKTSQTSMFFFFT